MNTVSSERKAALVTACRALLPPSQGPHPCVLPPKTRHTCPCLAWWTLHSTPSLYREILIWRTKDTLGHLSPRVWAYELAKSLTGLSRLCGLAGLRGGLVYPELFSQNPL